MLASTVIMVILAVILVLVGYFKGQGQHIAGIKAGINMTVSIVPMLLFAFIVAGMVQVLIPQAVISKWVGANSGIRGIIIGTIAGILAPGGPYISFPIVAGLMRAGASIGTTVAFLTGWSLLALSRLPMEVGILGWNFVLVRIISTFFFPPIAGIIAQFFFSSR